MKFKTPDFKNNFLFNSNDAKIYVDEVFPVLGKPKEEK
jgi:hypothetical protein